MPNAGGAGYYRTAQPSAELAALLEKGWARLTVEERLVTAQNTLAALQAGSLSVTAALPLLARLARDADGDVAQAPASAAAQLVERVVPASGRAAARRWAAALYAPALARLGLVPRAGEPAADTQLRVTAARTVAVVGREPALRARLARLGRAWLNPGGAALRPEAVPPDLVGLAAAVAVEDGGVELFDLAALRLSNQHDGFLRRRLQGVLSRARDPALVARAQAINAAPEVPLDELLLVVRSQAYDPELEQAGWDGFRRQADQAAARLPDWAAYQPYVTAGFCSAEREAEARAFFESRAQKNPAMARPLAESLESIQLCVAAVAAQQEEAGRAFQAMGR
jgi:hypothetical protein